MIKITCENGNSSVHVRGSIPEISTDLLIAVKQIREGIFEHSNDEEKFMFDAFLKDVFIDLVLAEDDKEKAIGILIDDIIRRVLRDDKDETEHKQD